MPRSDVKTKTFVAPCEGGPAHGRLLRVPVGAASVVVPLIRYGYLEYVPYNLEPQADGGCIWRFAVCACK